MLRRSECWVSQSHATKATSGRTSEGRRGRLVGSRRIPWNKARIRRAPRLARVRKEGAGRRSIASYPDEVASALPDALPYRTRRQLNPGLESFAQRILPRGPSVNLGEWRPKCRPCWRPGRAALRWPKRSVSRWERLVRSCPSPGALGLGHHDGTRNDDA